MAAIRKHPRKDGTMSYEVRIHRAGHPALSKSFSSLAEAKVWGNDTESKIDKGGKVSRKAETVLVSEALADFAAHYKRTDGAAIPSNEMLQIQALSLDLGDYAVSALSHERVEKYITALLNTRVPPQPNRKKIHPLYKGNVARNYAPLTVRKLYYQLKKVIEWHARREKYHLDPDVFAGQAIPAAWAGERDRRLEGDEEQRLYEAAGKGYRHKVEWVRIIGFALETAMRAQEILLARWQDIQWEGRTLNIPKEHVKTKTFRQVPLSKKAIEILRQQLTHRTPDSERVFWPWSDSNVLAAGFRRICHRASIDNLRFHDLRHEATSRFFEKGRLSDMEIMKITGHTEYSTLERYVKLRPSVLAAKMD